MQTTEQIKTALVANLNDLRMHGICLYINDLITRQTPESTVPAYRIYNKANNSFIENITQFKTAIVASQLKQIAPFLGERLSNDRVMGFNVVPTNLELVFSIHSKEDVRFSDQQNYFSDYGAVYNFQFFMCYMNDGDEIVPVKVSSVRLVKVL